MSIPSTYHLRNSLPNRSPSSRPRSLSLADYQPLSFDRDALESAYQAAITQPASSSTSWKSSQSQSIPSSAQTSETHATTPSTLSHRLKPGDNPHGESFPLDIPNPPSNEGGFAGVGAGHSLTPPQSPFHKPGQLHQSALLSPVPPTPPPRPAQLPTSTFQPGYDRRTWGRSNLSQDWTQRDSEEIDTTGYDTDPGPVVTGRVRRTLPPVPVNVPAPELPQWEPDYKPQIPPGLIEPSIENAYAQLSAPPPNLPPRRHRPQQRATPSSGPSGAGPSSHMGLASAAGASYADSSAGSSSAAAGPSSRPAHQTLASSSTVTSSLDARQQQQQLPAGAPEYPPQVTEEPDVMSPTSPTRPRPEAEKEVLLRATERTPIWSTHFLDPCLRNSMVRIPQQVTNITNIALSGLSSGPKERYDSTIGAPIDGLARAAKEWVVRPDGRFISEDGGIEVGVGVVDAGVQGWAREKGRSKARVEVISKHGGIKVDVVELDTNRQIDLKIETKSGDVLVLLPENFLGPIHVNSPAGPPQILSILAPQTQTLANPYSSFYTTFVVPLHLSRDPKHARSLEHKTSTNIQKYVPESFREQSDLFDQIAGGYASHTRGDHSKVLVTSAKGRVVIGYRDSKDESDVVDLGLKVGAQAGGRKKRWWR